MWNSVREKREVAQGLKDAELNVRKAKEESQDLRSLELSVSEAREEVAQDRSEWKTIVSVSCGEKKLKE